MKRGRLLLFFLSISVMLLVFSSWSKSAPLMIEKNLFSRDRKPPSMEATTDGQKRADLRTLRSIQLDGIMIRRKVKKALVRIKSMSFRRKENITVSASLLVREGEAIGDYRVTQIKLRSIRLEKAGDQYEVTLFSNEPRLLTPEATDPVSMATVPEKQTLPSSTANKGPGTSLPRSIPLEAKATLSPQKRF